MPAERKEAQPAHETECPACGGPFTSAGESASGYWHKPWCSSLVEDDLRYGAREPCPECGGRGYFSQTVVGYGHACGGDSSLCAQVCPVPEPEEERYACERCGGDGEIEIERTPAPAGEGG